MKICSFWYLHQNLDNPKNPKKCYQFWRSFKTTGSILTNEFAIENFMFVAEYYFEKKIILDIASKSW